MRGLAFLLASLFVLHDALAYEFKSFSIYPDALIDVLACHNALYSSATFCTNQAARGYKCYCSNQNAMASLAGCAKKLNPETGKTFKWFVNYCATQNVTITEKNLTSSLQYLTQNGKNFTAVPKTATSGNSTSSSRNSTSTSSNSTTVARNSTSGARNATASATATLASGSISLTSSSASVSSKAATNSTSTNSTTLSTPKSKTPTRIDFPIYANITVAYLYQDAYKGFYGNFNWAYWFSDALYAYWAFVFVVAALCNWSVVVFPKLRTVCNGRFSKAWRKYVTLPALIRKKRTNHQKFFGILNFLVPSRFETIVLSGFFWLTFLFNALYMDWHAGNPVFKTRYAAVLRMVADRTGVIGTMLLPLLILVGGRNNFLQWFTRWKFSTFITYHRWIGRVIVALVFVHSIAYVAVEYNAKRLGPIMRAEYIIYGTVGTVAGVIICFQGLLFLRRLFYEVFLAIHIMMAVAFILGAWRHIEMRMFMEWLIASVAVWAFDRFIRIVRMVSFGVPKATVTLLADDCLRVVVPKPKYWPSVPGGHAWVYFCHSWYFWQSHPFTFLDSTVEKNKIVFILKTKKGATHYLTKKLAKRPDRTCTIRVCVEGPYGEACSVKHHDNVVFVAGGNGIPGIFSECYDLARKSVDNAKQRIKLIWVLREVLTIEWVWEELHSLKNLKIEPTVYITRPEGGNDHILLERMSPRDDSSSEEKDILSKEGKDIIELLNEYFPHVNFKYGRPLMEAIVDEETEEATNSAAFITCGHPLMVDDLRYAVVNKIDQTEKRVDFFEQLQVWA